MFKQVNVIRQSGLQVAGHCWRFAVSRLGDKVDSINERYSKVSWLNLLSVFVTSRSIKELSWYQIIICWHILFLQSANRIQLLPNMDNFLSEEPSFSESLLEVTIIGIPTATDASTIYKYRSQPSNNREIIGSCQHYHYYSRLKGATVRGTKDYSELPTEVWYFDLALLDRRIVQSHCISEN